MVQVPGFAAALIIALAVLSPSVAAHAGEPVQQAGQPLATSSGDCLPRACHERIDEGFLDERRCRPPRWSCCNDPCTSCMGLLWAPVRVGIALVLLPIILQKPKCGRFPDLEGVALFFAFGVPIERCPEPRIPPPEPPAPFPEPPPQDGADVSMRF